MGTPHFPILTTACLRLMYFCVRRPIFGSSPDSRLRGKPKPNRKPNFSPPPMGLLPAVCPDPQPGPSKHPKGGAFQRNGAVGLGKAPFLAVRFPRVSPKVRPRLWKGPSRRLFPGKSPSGKTVKEAFRRIKEPAAGCPQA